MRTILRMRVTSARERLDLQFDPTFMSKPKFLPQVMPKSSRLMEPCASRRTSWPFFIGCGMHLNERTVSVERFRDPMQREIALHFERRAVLELVILPL